MKRFIFITALCAFAAGLWVESTQAIPAFARRYRLSCQTCHNPCPRLTEYGENFAGNGFQLPDGPEPARSFADVGDEELDLLRNMPIAARFDMTGIAYPDREGESETQTDFKFPEKAKLLSGGVLTKDIAYYFYFLFGEDGEVEGLEDAYIHFNNIGGVEFDIMTGQFQISDPLFKRELRLTWEDYQLYKQRIGESVVNLAYDRGVMFTFAPMDGTDLIFEVINGNGIDEAEDGDFDSDSFKNLFVRGLQSIGETGLSAGAFYYFARDTQHGATDEVTYWGVDASYGWKDTLGASFQYLRREDTDPFFTGTELEENLETDGALFEVVWAPWDKESRFYFTFLYNLVDSDFDVYDYETAAFNATHMIRRNIKGYVEYIRDIELEENVIVGGVVFAF